jgi:predicted nucleic acid-binding protein
VTTALDSSVLWAIAKEEQDGAAWLDQLIACRAEGRLVACDIVWAETRPAFPSAAAHSEFFTQLGVHFDASDESVANLAGEIQDHYRKAGGKRLRLTADFMIGAHAAIRADRLATKDDGFFRAQFLKLTVVRPL